MSWVSSIQVWRALAAHIDDTLGLVHDLAVGRSDHADGCLVLGPGYSRRMAIVPLPGDVGMMSPWLILLSKFFRITVVDLYLLVRQPLGALIVFCLYIEVETGWKC
jgi:hypothetical protein